MKLSKLQILITKFESIEISEDKTLSKLYTKLNDIVNSCFNLRERISKSKIVRKILRFLLKRFRLKVTTIK